MLDSLRDSCVVIFCLCRKASWNTMAKQCILDSLRDSYVVIFSFVPKSVVEYMGIVMHVERSVK
jgi:hypothetical protein